MAEYIKRAEVKDELLSWAVCIKHPEYLLREDALHVLDSIPAADVAPVVHGRWIEEDGIQICSNCGEEHSWDEYRATYCEDCGARMDGE